VSKHRALRVYGLLLYGFLYLPLAVVVLYSFNASRLYLWPMSGFSTQWYQALGSDEALIRSAVNSVQVMLGAIAGSVVIGTAGALAIHRSRGKARAAMQALTLLPILVPGLVMGLGLLLLFEQTGVRLSKATMIAGHVAFITPVVLFVILARLRQISPRLEMAARDLGAGPVRALIFALLPAIRSAILGGALLAATLSLDEVIISFLLTGVDNTLPVYIFSLMRFGISPVANAVYTILLIVTGVTILTSLRLTRGRRSSPRQSSRA
jgi:spermidine/putrescine transport system permease protein